MFSYYFLFPILTILGIPTSKNMTNNPYPKIIVKLLNYFVVPTLFTVILLSWGYILKVFLAWSLPKEKLAYITLISTILNILTYLLIYPLPKNSLIIRLFYDYMFKLLAIPIMACAVAIAPNIYNYGFTEPRYIIFVYLLWLTGTVCFSLANSGRATCKMILTSGAILFLCMSTGYFNSSNVATRSQSLRLKSLLEKNHLLVDENVTKPTGTVSTEDCEEISAIADYLVEKGRLEIIKPWFSVLKEYHLQQQVKHYDPLLLVGDFGITYIPKVERKGSASKLLP